MRLVAIDFETANAMPESACSVGFIVFDEGVEIDSFYTLIKPKKQHGQFHWGNISIHGIRPQDVDGAPGFDEVYKRIKPYFEDSVFVAHNADFDMRVFAKCCFAWDLPLPDLRYFCSVKLAKTMFPYLKHHRLNDCCQYIGIELDHHNAKSDAEACGQIVLNCMILTKESRIKQFLEHCNIPVHSLQKKYK